MAEEKYVVPSEINGAVPKVNNISDTVTGIQAVTSLPASPNAKTLYIITA